METEEKIALQCPYCGKGIYQPISWFKKDYFTCPACQNGLAAGQFSTALGAVENALDAHIDEMVEGGQVSGCCEQKSPSGCCGTKGSCH